MNSSASLNFNVFKHLVMKELQELCQSLKSHEIKFIRGYYKDNTDKKRLKLFDMVIKDPQLADEIACKKLYKSGINTAYSHLKARLKSDVLSVLIIQDPAKHTSSSYRQAEISCRRMMLEGDLLLRRGVYNLALKKLKKAAKIAEDFELPLERIMVEDLLRTHIGYKEGIKVYKEYSESIKGSLGLLSALLDAKELHNSILLPNLHKKNLGKEYVNEAKMAFERLRLSYFTTRSPNIGYLYHLAGLYYFDFVNDWQNALVMAQDLLKLVESEQAIQSKVRLANANIQIANIYVNQEQYDEAVCYAKNAVKLFGDGMMNQLIALEILFFALYMSTDIEAAGVIIDQASAHKKIRSSAFINGKWAFYKAAVAFKKGDHETSLDALNSDNTLLQDKSGWLFGHKLLEILNFMEQEQFEIIDFRVEALRKLLQRQKGKNITRVKTIFKILNLFVTKGYGYKETAKEMKQSLQLLREAKGDYKWEPMGFEIIRFDEWFDQKTGSRS